MAGIGGRGIEGGTAQGSIGEGPSSQRPIMAAGATGFFFDTSLGQMLYWGGAHWLSLAGTQVADYGPPAAPTNAVLPAITGTPQVGQTLAASTGTWTGSPTSYAYQWLRSGAAIAGATSASYAPASADIGATLACSVTATSATGSASATSAATAVVSGSVAGGGPNNRADFTDPNNAYLAALAA